MGTNVIIFYVVVCGLWTSNSSKLLSYFCWHYLKMSHPIKKKIMIVIVVIAESILKLTDSFEILI